MFILAKQSMSLSFTNATIDVEKDLITENPKKDVINFYKLSDILTKWNGVEGINISFKKDDDIKSDEDNGEDE